MAAVERIPGHKAAALSDALDQDWHPIGAKPAHLRACGLDALAIGGNQIVIGLCQPFGGRPQAQSAPEYRRGRQYR